MLTKEAVEHIAKLARLKVSDEELSTYSQQLSAVLANFQEIEKVNTVGIEPLLTPTEVTQFLFFFEAREFGNKDEMLANAPEKSGHLYKVPPVV